MAPKRRRAMGILGLALPGSSDDEDYRPAGRRKASTSAAAAAAAAVEEEDVPLAQRRRKMQQQQQQQQQQGPASPSGAPAAAPATAAAAGPAPFLPEAVLCHILRLACASGAIPTAAAAMCVSRSWRAAAEACPDLWHSIDLGWRLARPTDATVARSAPRWAMLRVLSLTGAAGVGDTGLQAIVAHCPRLSSLTLAHCTQFSVPGLAGALAPMLLRPAAPDGSSAPLTRLDLSFIQVVPKTSGLDAVVREVFSAQARNPGGPVLEELVIEGCPLLTHHALRAATEASAEQGRPLLGALKVLDLSQSAGARSDFALNIERLQFACPRLQQLRLNGLCGAYAWSFNATPSQLPPGAPPPGFPHLTACQVAAKTNPDLAGLGTGATNVNDACLTRLLARSPLLAELDVGGCERLSPDCLATAVHPAAPLQHALLARSGACCDEAVTFLVDRFGPTLEVVDLSWGGSRVSDAATAALARCPRLHAVGLAGTAVTTDGVRQLLVAADSHAATATAAARTAAAVADAAAVPPPPPASAAVPAAPTAVDGNGRLPFHLDVGSCRGLDRRVRQAATLGMRQLRAALGLPPESTD